MAVVSALRATRGRRVAVHVDGEYLCTVGEALLARWRLHKGRELDSEAVAELRREASAEGVVTDAHRLLAHRARSRDELRRRLLAKGHVEEAVHEALERLTRDGLLDDEAFARAFVHDKRIGSGWGRARLEHELTRLGVPQAMIDAAFAGDEGDDELARALAVLRRRPRPAAPYEGDKRRAYAALQRRGFSSEDAYTAVKLWIDAQASSAGDA